MYIYVCVSGMCHLTQRHAPNRPKLKMREKVACRQRTRPFYCENCGATLQLYVYIYIYMSRFHPSLHNAQVYLEQTILYIHIYMCVCVEIYNVFNQVRIGLKKYFYILYIYIYLYTYAGNLYIMFYPDVPCYICTTPISTGAGDNPCIFSFFVN